MKVWILVSQSHVDRTWIRRELNLMASLLGQGRVKVVGLPSRYPDFRVLRLATRLAKEVREPLIALCWFAFPSSIMLAKLINGITVVNAVGYEVAYYPHMAYGAPLNPLYRALLRLLLARADLVIAISEESARWARFWSGRHAIVIHEGIDVERFACTTTGHAAEGRDDGLRKIVTVSYLSLGNVVRKDLVTLVKAVALLVKRWHVDAKLIIIGEKGDGYPLVAYAAKRLGIADRVVFLGKVDHKVLLGHLCSSDVFVMTSLHEGFPTAVMEALSCGLPVITSDRPSMNEVLRNREHAIMVEPSRPEELAAKLHELLSDERLRRRLAVQGARLARSRYTLQVRKLKLALLLLKLITLKRASLRSRAPTRLSLRWILLMLAIQPIIALSLLIDLTLRARVRKALVLRALSMLADP